MRSDPEGSGGGLGDSGGVSAGNSPGTCGSGDSGAVTGRGTNLGFTGVWWGVGKRSNGDGFVYV